VAEFLAALPYQKRVEKGPTFLYVVFHIKDPEVSVILTFIRDVVCGRIFRQWPNFSVNLAESSQKIRPGFGNTGCQFYGIFCFFTNRKGFVFYVYSKILFYLCSLPVILKQRLHTVSIKHAPFLFNSLKN
jgi:hypothetical protein